MVRWPNNFQKQITPCPRPTMLPESGWPTWKLLVVGASVPGGGVGRGGGEDEFIRIGFEF